MTAEELLSAISEGRKKSISKDEVFSEKIDPSILKRIDKIFNKGLHYYLDPKSPEPSKDASIFFRKTEFGTDLNFEARKIVNQFEDFKISLSALAKLAELNIDRKLPTFSTKHDPKTVSAEIRKILYPEFNTEKKEFLRALITKFAEANILVFEFVETWNKKERANIDGVFLSPNVIVLKRQQSAFRREIFTLIHELGHYLLNEEEIEKIDVVTLAESKINNIERWCYDFAYYFLVGHYDSVIDEIDQADVTNDYHFGLIDQVSESTHLSKIALFTRLLIKNKIAPSDYKTIKADFDDKFYQKQAEAKKARELEKLQGIKQGGGPAKPINSPLLITTIQAAFSEGFIDEYEASRSLKTTPVKLDSFFK
jgi:Zn-dependent peptidase ImmA (M78 family)